jgi:hypothetical protein
LWDTDIIEEESEHVQTFRVVGEEVKDSPVLLDVRFWVRLKSVDHVRELHPIADEENRKVVSNKIKVPLSGVELDCKTTRVSQGLGTSTLMDNGGEPDNDRSLNTGSSEKVSTSEVRDIMSDLKETFSTGSSGMNHTLWNPFPVEIGKLLNEMVILKKDRTSGSNGHGGVVVPYRSTRVGGEEGRVVRTSWTILVRIHGLMRRELGEIQRFLSKRGDADEANALWCRKHALYAIISAIMRQTSICGESPC